MCVGEHTGVICIWGDIEKHNFRLKKIIKERLMILCYYVGKKEEDTDTLGIGYLIAKSAFKQVGEITV